MDASDYWEGVKVLGGLLAIGTLVVTVVVAVTMAIENDNLGVRLAGVVFAVVTIVFGAPGLIVLVF